jgi:hypothetical protein
MTIKKLLACLAAYILILFRHGYVFGSGDQSEMLPYAKYLADNTLYLKDFYIQSIAPFVPNERFVFSKLLSFDISHLAEWSFGLHALATVALLLGLRNLAEKWVVTEGDAVDCGACALSYFVQHQPWRQRIVLQHIDTQLFSPSDWPVGVRLDFQRLRGWVLRIDFFGNFHAPFNWRSIVAFGSRNARYFQVARPRLRELAHHYFD